MKLFPPRSAFAPVTDTAKVRSCWEAFRDRFTAGAQVRRVRMWNDGNFDYDVRWHPALGIWSCHVADWRTESNGRHDFSALFGLDEPVPGSGPDIVLEINYYADDPNRKMEGRFLRDAEGRLYIGHTGRVRQSSGGTLKVDELHPGWSQELVTVDWNRKRNDTEKVILIGAVDDPMLPERVAALVKTVHAIKKGRPAKATVVPSLHPNTPSFAPEFDGDSEYTVESKKILMRHEHGEVTNALAAEIRRLGYQTASDQARDVYIPSQRCEARVLFEVKKGNDTQSTYTAIGQLMFHGAAQKVEPIRVLVAPAGAKPTTMEALRKLGIKLVTFEKEIDSRIEFDGLDDLLESMEEAESARLARREKRKAKKKLKQQKSKPYVAGKPLDRAPKHPNLRDLADTLPEGAKAHMITGGQVGSKRRK